MKKSVEIETAIKWMTKKFLSKASKTHLYSLIQLLSLPKLLLKCLCLQNDTLPVINEKKHHLFECPALDRGIAEIVIITNILRRVCVKSGQSINKTKTFFSLLSTCSVSLFLFLIFMMIISCSEDINFNAPDYDKKIVVDGWIEGNDIPHVILTYSSPYLTEIDSNSIFEFVATRAKVTIERDDYSDILTLKPRDSFFPNYVYETTSIWGQTNKTYKLTISLDGQTLTAETTVPPPPNVDSIWFEEEPESDTLYTLKVKINDNPDQKNYYRILTKQKNVDNNYIPAFLPNLDDKYFNGEQFEYSVYRGNENILVRNDFIYFNKGDSIYVKVYTMDEASYKFWSTFNSEIYNAGNPFSESKAPIQTNINGGLGIWAGYGVKVFFVVAK